MRHWLATPADQQRRDWLKRFDGRFWTVDFPRPMIAAATTPGARRVRVDLSFLRTNDLAGLIWETVDRFDHPLLAYETDGDYRGCTLRFRWQSLGILPLDAVNGPTLTIEGRDASGTSRGWYVRLWNYAVGSPNDAVVTLDFDTLLGGFLLPGEGDPVFTGDIDRIFISLVPAGYTGAEGPLPAAIDASVTLSDITCDGPRSTLAIGDTVVPPHRLRMATGYDDSYNVTPARLVRGITALGHTGWVNHYVGMSHFFQLRWTGTGYEVDPARPVNGPAAAWHREFAARTAERGLTLIVSQSFEVLDQHCPSAWKQRDAAGQPALTGWVPPSTLLSPCNAAAQTWLQAVAAAFIGITTAAGHAAHYQIGEPWWWVGADHRPCFYDAATTKAFAVTGRVVPAALGDVRGSLATDQRAYLDWLGEQLGGATLALRDAVRALFPQARVYLLFYAPQVLAADAPDLPRANLPDAWTSPAFDVLQLEDYDFVIAGNAAGRSAARAAVTARLGYPVERQHYFAGFVLRPSETMLWPRIAAAADEAVARGTAETFVWAWPQVARDGFVAFEIDGEEAMPGFHDVRFPLAIGLRASGGPEFATQVATASSGFEQRNVGWSDARLHFDAGIGIRSENDLMLLIAFFRARRGRAHGFRFRDPLDYRSRDDGVSVSATDQGLATGDGATTRFALVKTYGADAEPYRRRVTRPVPGTASVAVDGRAVASGWQLADNGFIDFAVPPSAGAKITAGFEFDVPVRFDTDRLDIAANGWRSGDAASVPLIEIREG